MFPNKGSTLALLLARDRQTDRDRQRQTETDRDRQRQTETDRDRQRQTETDRDRQRQTETDRQRETDRQTETDRLESKHPRINEGRKNNRPGKCSHAVSEGWRKEALRLVDRSAFVGVISSSIHL